MTPTPDRTRHHLRRTGPENRRSGSIYAISTAGLVLMAGIGLSAVAMLRTDRANALSTAEISGLRRLAQSGLELAVQRISDTADWRKQHEDQGQWTWSIDGATVTVTLIDPIDGDLANDPFHDVVATAWAVRGSARQGLRARLAMLESGGPILRLAIASTGAIQIRDVDPLKAGAPIYTLADISAQNKSTIEADAYAVGTITATGDASYSGNTVPNAPVIDFPDTTRAFDAWAARATPIEAAKLADGYRLLDLTLGPESNPFGDTNPEGIYWIHAPWGARLVIRDVSIVGTLIITGVPNGVEIRGEFDAAAYNPSSPVLMIDAGTVITSADGGKASLGGLVLINGILAVDQQLAAAGPIITMGPFMILNNHATIEPTGLVPASPPQGFSTRATPALIDKSWIRAVN